MIFPYIGNVIIPTDFRIFFRGVNHQRSHQGHLGRAASGDGQGALGQGALMLL